LRAHGVLSIGVKGEGSHLLHQFVAFQNGVGIVVGDNSIIGDGQSNVTQSFLLQPSRHSFQHFWSFVRIDPRALGRIAVGFVEGTEVLEVDLRSGARVLHHRHHFLGELLVHGGIQVPLQAGWNAFLAYFVPWWQGVVVSHPGRHRTHKREHWTDAPGVQVAQPVPGRLKNRRGVAVVVILPVHDAGIVIIIGFLPVAIDQVRNHAKHRDPKIVDQHVEHCFLIVSKVRSCVIHAESLDLLILLTRIDDDARISLLLLCVDGGERPKNH
jgi:hypothetical protein